ncbi:7089_t:CDS:1, partial [Acaulospora morrowiae]
MTAKEYININDNVITGGGLIDKEIVEIICPPNEESEELNKKITVRPIVSVKEVLGVSNAIEFLINPSEDFAFNVKIILELCK